MSDERDKKSPVPPKISSDKPKEESPLNAKIPDPLRERVGQASTTLKMPPPLPNKNSQ